MCAVPNRGAKSKADMQYPDCKTSLALYLPEADLAKISQAQVEGIKISCPEPYFVEDGWEVRRRMSGLRF